MNRCVESVVIVVLCQAEDGIRDLVRSRGLGDVYKRQEISERIGLFKQAHNIAILQPERWRYIMRAAQAMGCLLYTSDAADERSSVDLGGRRIIKKKQNIDATAPLCRIISRQTLHLSDRHSRSTATRGNQTATVT